MLVAITNRIIVDVPSADEADAASSEIDNNLKYFIEDEFPAVGELVSVEVVNWRDVDPAEADEKGWIE